MSPDSAENLSERYSRSNKANHDLGRRMGLGKFEIAKLLIYLDGLWGSVSQIIPSNFSNLNQVVAFIMLLIFMYFSWSSSFKFRLDNFSILYFIFVLFVCVSVTWSDSDFQKYFRMFLFLATTSFAFFLSRQFPSEFIFTCLLKVMLFLSIISLLLVFFKPSDFNTNT